MTATNRIVVIEAPTREQLVEHFASRSTHLTSAQIRKRFDVCVPKIRYCNIGDEDHRGQAVM
jgi:hypothetical protein